MNPVRFFLLIELDFFIVYFFFYVIEKIILEKNYVIKLYEVTKIKRHDETIINLTLITQKCFVFFFF